MRHISWPKTSTPSRAERQLAYYVKAWRRAQANDMPLDEPLVRGICEAWESINQLGKIIDTLKAERPQLYRPLVSPVRNSGLSATESAWAERQRRAAAEVEAGKRPEPPRE